MKTTIALLFLLFAVSASPEIKSIDMTIFGMD
jgi:hypothetical protein